MHSCWSIAKFMSQVICDKFLQDKTTTTQNASLKKLFATKDPNDKSPKPLPQIYGHGNDNDELKLTAHFSFRYL